MNDSLVKENLSPWWRRTVILVLAFGFTVLIWMTTQTYRNAPPIPGRVVTESGETIFTADDILSGQEVFLRYGLMENGTVWGHGGYLGPDFSAAYLHALALEAGEMLAKKAYDRRFQDLKPPERAAIEAEVQQALKQNRYDPKTKILSFTAFETASYRNQIDAWK